MVKTAKDILSLNHEEVMDFFMKSEWYHSFAYNLRLCQLVAGKAVEPLWNSDWLKAELTVTIPYDSIVDGETLKKVTPVITFRDTRLYNEY